MPEFEWRIHLVREENCIIINKFLNRLSDEKILTILLLVSNELLATTLLGDIDPTIVKNKCQQLKYCCRPDVGQTSTHQRWFLSNGSMIAQHVFAVRYRVNFPNLVRFSLILQFRRWELFLGKRTRGWVAKSNQMNVSQGVNMWNQFFLTKPVSIKHTDHTKQKYTGTTCSVGKLFIWKKHFRNNPLIGESFPGENHFLVFCIHRIIQQSLVIFVDHDWNGSVGVLYLCSVTLPPCRGLR